MDCKQAKYGYIKQEVGSVKSNHLQQLISNLLLIMLPGLPELFAWLVKCSQPKSLPPTTGLGDTHGHHTSSINKIDVGVGRKLYFLVYIKVLHSVPHFMYIYVYIYIYIYTVHRNVQKKIRDNWIFGYPTGTNYSVFGQEENGLLNEDTSSSSPSGTQSLKAQQPHGTQVRYIGSLTGFRTLPGCCMLSLQRAYSLYREVVHNIPV